MKNNLLYTLLIALFCLPKQISAQECEIPNPFTGNTGINMTVVLSQPFINSLNVTDRGAYLVALDPNGLVVGSEIVASVTQQTIAIWGDDSSTPEYDGAASNAAISFQLVDGSNLYDVEMPNPVSFVGNNIVFQVSAAVVTFNCTPPVLGCTDDDALNYNENATVDDNSCYGYCGVDDWLVTYPETNTGLNMSVLLSGDFIDQLSVENSDAYIVAVTSSGISVGSLNEIKQGESSSLIVNGDDTISPEVDGATEGEEVSLYLIDGLNKYLLSSSLTYFSGNMLNITDSQDMTLVCVAEQLGCTDESACNYESSATNDDGSCTYAQTYYDCSGTCLLDDDNDGTCNELEISGCTSASAFNFNTEATEDDASCIGPSVDCSFSEEDLPKQFTGNTGESMIVFLQESFFDSFPIIDDVAYIVAVSESGMNIGSNLSLIHI